jgi:hypothetical protein
VSRRRLLPWLAAGAIFALGLALVGWLGAGTERELDLRTGRARTVRHLAWLPIGQRVEPTALSRALAPEDLRGAEPLWRALRGAEAEIGMVELTWKCGRFSPEARRLVAKDVLALWEELGAVEASRPFMKKVEDLVETAGSGEITARDVLGAWRAAEAERAGVSRPPR